MEDPTDDDTTTGGGAAGEPAGGPPVERSSGAEGTPAAPAPPPATPPPGGQGPGRSRRQGALFAIAAIVLLVGSMLAGRAIFGRDRPEPEASPTASPTGSPSPTAPRTKRYRNQIEGVAFEYPANWRDLESDKKGPTTVALLGTGAGELLKLDVFKLDQVIGPEVLRDVSFQDALQANIQAANEQATITLRELTSINGVNAMHFRYQFKDATLGLGIHDHWFFFSGGKMETLVFQVFPSSEYPKFSETFARIVRSYQSVPLAPQPGQGSPPPSPTASG
jgi:hypothetical protein